MASSCASCSTDTGHASGESCHVLSSKSGCPLSAVRICSKERSDIGLEGTQEARKRKSGGAPGFRGSCLKSFFHLDILVAMTRASRPQPGVDETVEVAIEHALRVARADTRAQVLHHLVGL